MSYQPASTGVKNQQGPTLPTTVTLDQNYPNPFNPTTQIGYAIGQSAHVTLKVYDVLGREVATLVDEQQEPGTHSVRFGTDTPGRALSSGVYFYRLDARSFHIVRKMMTLTAMSTAR